MSIAERVAIIGDGYIGLKVAAVLRKRHRAKGVVIRWTPGFVIYAFATLNGFPERLPLAFGSLPWFRH